MLGPHNVFQHNHHVHVHRVQQVVLLEDYSCDNMIRIIVRDGVLQQITEVMFIMVEELHI